MIKKKMYTIYESRYFPFFLLFAAMMLLHLFTKFSGDDLDFQNMLSETPYFPLLAKRYQTWTSRLLIESVLFLVVKTNIFIFALLDSLFIVFLLISLSKLINNTTSRTINWLMVLLFLIYPFHQMSSAGWVATTLNYIWPTTAALFAMIPFAKKIRNEEIKPSRYALYIAALLYASNTEQICALLCGFGLIFNAYIFIKERRIKPIFISWIIIPLANLVIIMQCPGNLSRFVSNVNTYFPEYTSLSHQFKLYLGVSNTLNYLFNNTNILLLLLSSMLFFVISMRQTSRLSKLVASIPFIFCLITNLGYLTGMHDTWLAYARVFFSYLDLSGNPYSGLVNLIPALICLCILGLTMLAFYQIYGKSRKSVFYIIMLLAGLASAIMLGFSPTVYASSKRIFFPLDIIIILLTCLIYFDNQECFSSIHSKVFLRILAVLAFFSYCESFGITVYILRYI